MEGTLKTRQLTEYKTLSNGQSGCLFFVGANELDKYSKYSYSVSTIYLLKSACREKDKAPFVDGLHETEKQQLAKKQPLLTGYPAWVAAIRLTSFLKNKVEVNNQVYRDALAKIGGKDYYSVYEYETIKKNKKVEAEYEELFGKEDWSYIKHKCEEGIEQNVSERYENKNILTEDGKLDYAKALFDLEEDFENEYRRVHIDINKRLEMLNWGAMITVGLEENLTPYMDDYEWEWMEEGLTKEEMDEKCQELYDEESPLYHASGFIAALMNLARNQAIYRYATGYKGDLYGPNLGIKGLRFDFDIATKELCEKYLQQVEDYYKREEAKKPDVLDVDAQQIDIRILKEERINSKEFFRYTRYPHLIPERHLKTLKSYSQALQKLLVGKIGFDPDEKKEEEVKEEERPAELCEYINLEKVAKVGVKTAEDVEKELSQASSCKAPVFVELLQTYQKVGYLDFKGHEKKLIYENLKKHYGNMDYSYKNFVAYC